MGSIIFLFLLTSCSTDDNPQPSTPDAQPIAFAASVVPSQTATRADASIVNRKETLLTPTNPSTHPYTVGLFGTYTGQLTWAQYKAANADNEPAPNFFFNQEATVMSVSAQNNNPLDYSPERFWPNETVGTSAQTEYASFWAYYPYNPSADPGNYGIAILPNSNGSYGIEKGMGTYKFTMHPDAAQHTDFLLSELAANCNRTNFPLQTEGGAYSPTPVPLRFHHMLAQVRLYAFVRATDRLVYATADGKELTVTSIDGGSVTLSNGTKSWVCSTTGTIMNAWGVEEPVKVGSRVPDDTEWLPNELRSKNSIRWKRKTTTDRGDNKLFAEVSYSMSLNNIYTSGTFSPAYNTTTGTTSFPSAVLGSPTGTATVSNYVQNPYWFLFSTKTGEEDRRVMLNDDFMYDYFGDAPSNRGGDNNALGYAEDATTADPHNPSKHYNFAPANVLLVMPQTLADEDVPHIIINMKGQDASSSEPLTARVTINMLQMNIKWESGFIYCYAFVDELMPGDDKVRGPETITVVFDPDRHTDQW
ncbi:MAG: fimbrillin family protein [Prevotella sp.]|nr:fimbrillin family protein [Prevotella sp.]